jgi:hypothetical protein
MTPGTFGRWTTAVVAAFTLGGSPAVLAQDATPAPVTFGSTRVIGVETIANDLMVDETLVGGLSGIDYDAETGAWIVLSDDRSDNQPARFYTLDLAYSEAGIDTLSITAATTLLQANGDPYPNAATGGAIPDPESIRFDPLGDGIWYSSEGARSRVIDPFIAAATLDGELIAMPTLSDQFGMETGEIAGPRENLVFEGMTFDANGRDIWLALEGPLYQDGGTATVEDGAVTRITRVDRTGATLAQFAYELEPIPGPADAFYTTGVTEILAIDETRFLTIERTTVEDANGVFNNIVKVYEIDIAGATDVKSQGWLTEGSYTPVTKTLVFDANASMDYVDNLEGITWGPELANGNRSLVIVSDNNFNAESQQTQVIVLEIGA